MTTPRDLLFVAMDAPSHQQVGQGDLSLALAGAELLDLLETGGLTLDGDRIVPGAPQTADDRLLTEASAALNRGEPHETVPDWLWRRGQGLATAYLDAVEEENSGSPRRRISLLVGRADPLDSPGRKAADERWASGEVRLAALGAAVGLRDAPDAEAVEATGDAVVTVLAAVDEAVVELEAVRQRRSIEDAAFDNVWRAP
ncbi:GPP34 family phosphoprotein [Streptomyces mangrovisoli]|uniref:GPP34 family phosphoprotein n=1 Tax=Streptomyces mangrovisoli TaxID=1428628 RepID=A0A1J4NR79_9ACTN|nr:GPP34 family phosphoprotein [Streptomyces mangrovisoli]OIJ64618.1 hypothetical protein WN71_028085 [Streptomyces mangrovisoli]